MRSDLRFAFAFAAFVACAGCSAALFTPDERDAGPGVSVEELLQGRSIYVTKCGTCHALPLPEAHTMPAWERHIAEMGPRAHLSARDSLLVRRYIEAGNRRARGSR